VKKVAAVIFALALLVMFAVVAPVMAIGPEQAFDVGLNPNLWFASGGVHNGRTHCIHTHLKLAQTISKRKIINFSLLKKGNLWKTAASSGSTSLPKVNVGN